jgi:hypothetical protein
MTIACQLAEMADALRNRSGQPAADAAETAAILRYLGLSVGDEEAER